MVFKDYFSQGASEYAQRRPQYPPALFKYLASLCAEHGLAWDCGTGNGQAARGLIPYFDRVLATDPSEEQLKNAFRHEKITYRVARAEGAGVEPSSVDLLTVAQALHWFDLEQFYAEAQRALKPQGVLAVWAYSLCRIEPDLDRIIDHFYFEKVGPYWPKERQMVDDGYRSIPFPFAEVQPPSLNIELMWDLGGMVSYLRTWSPVKIFIKQHGRDPVAELEPVLGPAWGNPQERKLVRWPIHMRVGRNTYELAQQV